MGAAGAIGRGTAEGVKAVFGAIIGIAYLAISTVLALAVPLGIAAYLTHGHLWGVRHAHQDERAVCTAAQRLLDDINANDASLASTDLDGLRSAGEATSNSELRSASALAASDLGTNALTSGLDRIGTECQRIQASLHVSS